MAAAAGLPWCVCAQSGGQTPAHTTPAKFSISRQDSAYMQRGSMSMDAAACELDEPGLRKLFAHSALCTGGQRSCACSVPSSCARARAALGLLLLGTQPQHATACLEQVRALLLGSLRAALESGPGDSYYAVSGGTRTQRWLHGESHACCGALVSCLLSTPSGRVERRQ